MKLGSNVILISGLSVAATLTGLPRFAAVAFATTTTPSSQSSHKPLPKTSSTALRARKRSGKVHAASHTAHASQTAQPNRTISHHAQTSKLSRTGAKSGHKSARHKAVAKRSTAYTRLARMQMDPARVENIQQALIGAGELHGAPTGRWDEATREAMARYQTANGFGATGLPDAKSLMKLGLGPHPLPPQLDKSKASSSNLSAGGDGAAPSNPSVQAPASTAPSTGEATPSTPPATTDPPAKQL
jgi:Putative peptidoglycan binding domain